MASNKSDYLHTNLNVPSDIRRKKISGQQKREALEREVSVLEKMLKQEEKVHEILGVLQKKNDASAFSIPNFLPPKAKELLAELAMVESEIIRLESQISHLKQGLKREQELTKDTKSKQNQLKNSANYVQTQLWSNAPLTMPSPLHRSGQEKMGFESKALHFISKAIKGDYNNNGNGNDFTLDQIGSSRIEFSDQKQNQFQEVSNFQDRVPRKSGLLKSPSPMRDPRHPSPKPKERHVEFAIDPLPKSLSNAILSEETNIQQLQPNKLSENIIKCLNFIYIRLLRTSRAMELEKSGPISRSLQASLSFRTDTSSNSKTNLIMLQKESRQQDPYGIFNSEESITRDIGPYKNLVIFTSSSMDPKCISSSSSIPLLKRLRVLMNNLESVDLRFLTYHQKLAFWINMYNACIMHGFIQYGVPSTPEKLFTLMNKATLNIGGNTINAQAIEQYILRKPNSSNKSEKDEKEGIVRKLYGLESMDPNVTFALCCGTRSSPAVRVYTGDNVTGELEKSKLEYLQASIIVTTTKRIAFPQLLLKNTFDFALDTNSLVEWVCHQLPTSGSLRKSIVDCFRTQNSGKIATISVDKLPYDFEFQYLLAI
ncbi:uncharacterized protein LOC126668919 [Mercurialis annua]|uniref:uncharacterized protein LOC126668919 n=1 Tax=Mercurialis annua TaxID=3986 RepID=UPI002160F098|nr:uncharacterized protein LOC126668919 [Mercurialis annua]